MKRLVWPAVQFVIGIGLVAALLWGIHRSRSTVEGVLDGGIPFGVGFVYSAHADHGVKVTVQAFSEETRRITLSCNVPAERAAALCTSICYLRSQDEHVIAVRHVSARSSGLSALAAAFLTGVARWPWLLLSMLAVASTALFCCWRWFILLKAQGIDIGIRRAGELYLMGAFFSILLPGAVSGDLVKGWYVSRDAAGGRRAEAATTVLLDRAIGLAALVLLAVLVLAWQWPRFGGEAGFRAAAAGVAAVAGTIVVLAVFSFSRWSLPGGRIGDLMGRVREVFRLALADRRVLAPAMLLSIINHAALIAAECAAAAAVGVRLDPGSAIAGFMLVNIVASLPVTPGGLGSREAACLVVLGWFGVPGESAFAISLLTYGWILLIALAGGVVWALRRPGRAAAVSRDGGN